MPEITTAIRIPEPVARKTSAMFIATFLFQLDLEYKKLGDQFAEFFIRGIGPGVI